MLHLKYGYVPIRAFKKHSLFGFGYQISPDVFQLQILIQWCKLAKKCISHYIYYTHLLQFSKCKYTLLSKMCQTKVVHLN